MNIFKNKQTHEYKEKERYRLRRARIWGYKIGKKYAIGEKIAKANAWADGHRRKTAGILFSVNATIYAIGLLLCMSGNDSNSINDLEAVQLQIITAIDGEATSGGLVDGHVSGNININYCIAAR